MEFLGWGVPCSQLKINAGIGGDYVPFKINFITTLRHNLLFHFSRVEKKLKMTLVSFDVLTSPK